MSVHAVIDGASRLAILQRGNVFLIMVFLPHVFLFVGNTNTKLPFPVTALQMSANDLDVMNVNNSPAPFA